MTHRQRSAAIVQHHWRIAESPLYPKGRGLAAVRTTLASAGLHPTTGTSEGNRSSFCYQEPGPIALRATSLIPGASSQPLPRWEEQHWVRRSCCPHCFPSFGSGIFLYEMGKLAFVLVALRLQCLGEAFQCFEGCTCKIQLYFFPHTS